MNFEFVLFCTYMLAELSVVESNTIPCGASNLIRTSLEGNISYSSNLRREECTWKLPAVDHRNHALFIFLQHVYLTFTELGKTDCAGNLILPELGSICTMPVARCLLYIPVNSDCDATKIDAYVKDNLNISQCSSKLWYDVTTVPDTIKTKAKYQDLKNFSLSYSIVKCTKTAQVFSKVTKLDTNLSQTGNKSNSTTPDDKPKSSSSTAFIIIIIILVSLLICALLFIARVWRKRHLQAKKTKTTEKPLTTTGYVSATDIQQIGINDQPSPPPSGEDIPTNHYEEISQTRFQRSDSREFVENVIY